MNPRVSVLMSVYNGEQFLEEAIESIINQTFHDFELIIVDDGSLDSTPQILARYQQRDPRIILHRFNQNQGLSTALNFCIRLARGEYVARMDADDISLPHRLEKQVMFMDKHNEIGLCGAWMQLIGYPDGTVFRYPEHHETIHIQMLFTNSFGHPVVMWRAATFNKLGLLYNESIRFGQDYELWSRALLNMQVANIGEILMLYRVHQTSISSMHRERQIAIHYVIYKRLLASLIEPDENELILHQKISTQTNDTDFTHLRQARSWLEKLSEINRQKGTFPSTLLNSYLGRLWSGVCSQSSAKPIRIFGEILSCRLQFCEESGMKKLVKAVQFFVSRFSIKNIIRNRVKIILGERGWTWLSGIFHKVAYRLFERRDSIFAFRLQHEIHHPLKIGMAVLAYERAEYLELCLNSLFSTKLYDYDITFLIQDDGSTDPRIREIIERQRDPRYKIVRYFTPKGHNSWGAAFNKAIKKLLEIDDFDIVGSCDSDAIFHPEWLDQTMKICLWAKKNHTEHILGPFSSFNSSDYEFHRILGNYSSPLGNYLVKYRMGALNYFYFTKDLLKLGYFEENKDDETIMTARFDRLKVRSFCTETSYVEHVGHLSVLNQWRPSPVNAAVYGMNLVKTGWGNEIEKADTLGYYKYVKENKSFGESLWSDIPLDVLIPAVEKDMLTLPQVIDSVKTYLKHPITNIFIVAPPSPAIEHLCQKKGCTLVLENTVAPIALEKINLFPNGVDRRGWLYQQFLKLSGDTFVSQKHFFVLDADTSLTCPQVFIVDNKTVLLHSDEHHHPYFQVYQKLFGIGTSTNLSFVAHQMLFNTVRLMEMKQQLEEMQGRNWYDVIMSKLDAGEQSAFSEYETYGQWMLQNHPDEIRREYWFNVAVPRSKYLSNKNILSSQYRSLSSHTQ